MGKKFKQSCIECHWCWLAGSVNEEPDYLCERRDVLMPIAMIRKGVCDEFLGILAAPTLSPLGVTKR